MSQPFRIVPIIALLFSLVACGGDPKVTPPDGSPDTPAAPSPATLKLAGPATFVTYTCAALTISMVDAVGIPATSSAPTTVTIAGFAAGRAYNTLADCRSDATSTPSIPAGASMATIYVRTSTAGALTLTASSAGLASADLTVTVTLFQVLGQTDADSSAQTAFGVHGHGVYTAGGKLFVYDASASRVLIWNTIPTSSAEPPSLVLGRPNLSTSGLSPLVTGSSLGQIGSVWTDGVRLLVSDYEHNRVLVWTTFPTTNGQSADFALGQPAGSANLTSTSSSGGLGSTPAPAGIASDGTRLFVVVSSGVLVWNTFPTIAGQPASYGLAGMQFPTGIAIIGTKLFVADSGHNRVLVWNQVSSIVASTPPDFALGQPAGATNLTSFAAATTATGMSEPNSMTSDGTRLFVSDQLNHRVLVWNTIPISGGQPADFALGQPAGASNLTTAIPNNGGTTGSSLNRPLGIATDGTRLFVGQAITRRLLVWNTLPTVGGESASYALGQIDLMSSGDPIATTARTMSAPFSVYSDGTRLFACDVRRNRVLVWNALPLSDNTPPDFALGQPAGALNLTSNRANNGGVSGSSLAGPLGVYSDGSRLFVADSDNNRVLVWATMPTTGGQPATFALGQPTLTSRTSNIAGVSGSSMFGPHGIAHDGTRLYVADQNNHRVLVWTTLPTATGQAADFALGQPAGVANLTSAAPDEGGVSGSSMEFPGSITSDGTRLFVSDSYNSRVLVWSAPPTTGGQTASFALGQPAGANNLLTDLQNNGGPSASSMSIPSGIQTAAGRLFVADQYNSRILVWSTLPTAGGQAATSIVGQTSVSAIQPNDAGGPSATHVSFPNGLFLDGPRLFIADSFNNRILIAPAF